MFESVDLPAPFSPSSACTSPSTAAKSTPSFATTPGNRLVIPRRETATAMEQAGGTRSARPPGGSALRAPDDAPDEVVHRVEVVERRSLARLDPHLAALIVDRPEELVPLAAHDQRALLRDQLLRLRRDVLAVRREGREAVLDVPVVVAGLPGPVHRSADTLRVVRAPVVDRGRQPGVLRELLRVRVVADPRDAGRLGVLARRRAVDVLAEDVRPGGVEALGGLLLLVRREPGVRPDDPHLRARMRLLHAECERVRVPDHL